MQEQQSYERKSDNAFLHWLFEKKYYIDPTITRIYVIFIVFAILFALLAISMFVVNSYIVESRIQNYNKIDACKTVLQKNKSCQVKLQITEYMTKPIFLLYELNNFYQNHRRYVQSKHSNQLEGKRLHILGKEISQKQAQAQCEPIIYNSNLNTNLSWGGTKLDPKQIANPCGLIAKSYFNDTYKLINPKGLQIFINETGISQLNDKTKLFKRAKNSSNIQWIDPQNEHFIVWMQMAALPNFKKLWGRIDEDLEPGNYTIQIMNNYNIFLNNGNKNVILTNTSIFGSKTYLLPVILSIASVICIIILLIFFIKSMMTSRKFGMHID